jgi:dihydrofolate synthase / folylpolyglutamate synthase
VPCHADNLDSPIADGRKLMAASSYETAVARMFALGHELAQTPAHKFDLVHVRRLLQAMEHPERSFPSVLIAGTNGKGSTAATLASILRASSLKTGLYTSPHLVRINERIRIDGIEINDDNFASLHGEVEAIAKKLVERGELPWHPSFFEMMTAIAFECFARERIDIAVLEVGMGGRLDATNVVDPRVSVITDISLDHEKYLGNTVAEIAREKAGIIRPGGPVVTLPQHPEANDVIGNAILNLAARAMNAVPYVPSLVSPESRAPSPGAYVLQVMGEEILVQSPLVGRHQLRNVALAVATAVELSEQGFHGITPHTIERGIRETRWPGRFQTIPASAELPEIVIDVAHNPAGAWALRCALSERYEGRSFIFLFAAMRDKAVSEMAEILFPLADRVIATRPQNPRAASPEEIRSAAVRTPVEIDSIEDVAQALERARSLALESKSVLVITGSIYLVGEVMAIAGSRI